jgi:hypothetical protein
MRHAFSKTLILAHLANQRVERTGGSRLALLQFERQRRLPPVAHADR